ncbi:hypothetical protein [Rhodoflexus caldus]|uniref:hypothetical protein n=1 Tax=Rhodoflexus caldus TaxID=2891236 RepID=UPI00202A5420|nr:hypothetical protein [Rhodoflexus caldus]
MNSKYDIRIDPPQPSEAEIQAQKDFNRVLVQFRRSRKRHSFPQMLERFNKILPALILALLIAAILILYARLTRKTSPVQEKNVPALQKR